MNGKKPTYVEIKIAEVRQALAQFSPNWTELEKDDADMAAAITASVEIVGGRSEAAKIMGVGLSSVDNYRTGKRQPRSGEFLKLMRAKAAKIKEIVSASRTQLPPSASRAHLRLVPSNDELEQMVNLYGKESGHALYMSYIGHGVPDITSGEDTPAAIDTKHRSAKPIVGSYDPDAEQNDEGYSHETWKAKLPGARPEIDVRLGAGEGTVGQLLSAGASGGMSGHRVVAEWVLPDSFLKGVIEANAARTIVMEIVGDSMQPTYQPGDRVLVDLAQTRLVADTVYAISDGYSEPQIKRLQRVPFSDPPRVRIISDNPALETDEVELERVQIIGRICGVMARR